MKQHNKTHLKKELHSLNKGLLPKRSSFNLCCCAVTAVIASCIVSTVVHMVVQLVTTRENVSTLQAWCITEILPLDCDLMT